MAIPVGVSKVLPINDRFKLSSAFIPDGDILVLAFTVVFSTPKVLIEAGMIFVFTCKFNLKTLTKFIDEGNIVLGPVRISTVPKLRMFIPIGLTLLSPPMNKLPK